MKTGWQRMKAWPKHEDGYDEEGSALVWCVDDGFQIASSFGGGWYVEVSDEHHEVGFRTLEVFPVLWHQIPDLSRARKRSATSREEKAIDEYERQVDLWKQSGPVRFVAMRALAESDEHQRNIVILEASRLFELDLRSKQPEASEKVIDDQSEVFRSAIHSLVRAAVTSGGARPGHA